MLEIGCSDGGNLIAMALGLPESSFVGIDAAGSSIALGRERVAELGLTNVELLHADLTNLSEPLGQFDYVISHGVYSWVPPPVRAKLLELCRDSLLPDGVAYVSYNAYPGGLLRRAARDLMRFHLGDEPDPGRRIEDGLSALSRLTAGSPPGSPYRLAMEAELKLLVAAGSSFVFHDALAPENQPFYFSEFCAAAAQHGLGFLTEAHFVESTEAAALNGLARPLPDGATDELLRAEQYLDFAKGRMFRQTLLVHASALPRRRLSVEQIRQLFVSARIEPAARAEHVGSEELERFQAPRGVQISTDNPVAKTALKMLADAYPRMLSFGELLEAVLRQTSLSGEAERAAQDLSQVLLICYANSVVELRSEPARLVLEVSDRPLASPWARLQAREDGGVTNLRHTQVTLTPDARRLLCLVDGAHTRLELAQALFGGDEASAEGDDVARVEQLLRELAALGLLIG